MVIGERLKTVRESKNMSQGDVEKRTGLLRCYVSRCENGHTIPTLDTLEKWSKALGISMSQLFADNGKASDVLPALKKNGQMHLNRTATNHLRRVMTAFSKMETRDIAVISQLAHKFAERQRRA